MQLVGIISLLLAGVSFLGVGSIKLIDLCINYRKVMGSIIDSWESSRRTITTPRNGEDEIRVYYRHMINYECDGKSYEYAEDGESYPQRAPGESVIIYVSKTDPMDVKWTSKIPYIAFIAVGVIILTLAIIAIKAM